MIVRDWRSLAAAEVAPWYEAEREWWASRLEWDTTRNWREVETARVAGRLPGFAMYEQVRPVGWAFFLLHRGTLQIGGLCASSPEGSTALLGAMLESDLGSVASDVLLFLPDSGCGLHDELRSGGFEVQRYLYLVRSLDALVGAAGEAVATFHGGWFSALIDLLGRAYGDADSPRPFASAGTPGEWTEYAGHLVAGTACGELMPACSVVEEASPPGRLGAAVLTTRIGPRIGHIAQVAVDPVLQGRGIGRRLTAQALRLMREHGLTRASLLVAEGNLAARRIYEQLGFSETEHFLFARRANARGVPGPQPLRSTIAACSTGGVSTFR